VGHQGDVLSSQERPNTTFSQHLQLPTVATPARKRGQLQPIIDYSESIRLTDPVHLAQLKVMRDRRQVAAKAAEEKKLEYKRKNEERAAAKQAKECLQKEKAEERAVNKRLQTYWENVKNNGWGNKLQELLKSGTPSPPGTYRAPYCGTVPPICIQNQRIAKMRLELKKQKRDGRLVIPTTPIPWARNCYSTHPPVE
jgi:hypothetical protein